MKDQITQRSPDRWAEIIEKEFARKLADNGMTISFLRKGKEAITLGKDAKPTLLKVITRSDDVQINSVTQTAKLKRDFKVD